MLYYPGVAGDAQTKQDGLFETEPKLSVETVGGVTRVRIDALLVASFDEDDEASRRMTMVSLAEGGSFTANEIAKAFGVDPTRLSQLRRRYAEGGAALLLATHGGKPGPQKLKEGDIARIRAWRRAGKKIDEILAIVNRRSKRVGRSTIGALVKGIGPEEAIPTETVDLFPPRRDAECAPAAVTEPAAADVLSIAAPQDVERASTAALLPAALPVAEVPSAEAVPPLEVPAEPAPVVVTGRGAFGSSAAPEPPAFVRASGVAGVMVAHVAIAALGLREALEASGARLKPSRTFDLLRTAAVVLFGIFLRFRSIESLRMLVRDDFGALLAIGRAPEIRTIRRKLAEIGGEAAGFEGAAMVRSLAGSLLRSAAVPDGVYFFDDHFKPYHGKQPLAKGWDAKRRLAAPGLEDVYVHDLKGRVLLFVPLKAPTSLSKALPLALAELRAVGAALPKLAVFDRGGFSRALFLSLVHPPDGSARVDFLTYLVERGKRRELPRDRFQEVTITIGGRRRSYELAESSLAMRGFEQPLRLIVLLDRIKGRQVPILTSDDTTPATHLVHFLRARWRQENSFKYLIGELSIDALVSREVELNADEREIDNPERQALREKLALAERELALIDRELGEAIAENQESRRPTVRGFKIAHGHLNQARKDTLDWIMALREDIARLPAKVRRTDREPEAKIARPKTRRRVFVNALKILAHNAEKWLADRMGPGPYGAHALPILRALFNQSGRVALEQDRVVVEIDPLDTPRYQACVERLFEALNREGALFLDSGKRLELKVSASSAGTVEGTVTAPCHEL